MESEEGRDMVGRKGGGNTRVLSDVMGAVDQASYNECFVCLVFAF